MVYCRNCGAQIDDNEKVCPYCKAVQDTVTENAAEPVYKETRTEENYQANTYRGSGSGSFGWGLLGFCIPIVGLILFIVWNRERPEDATAAGIGALVSVIISIIVAVATAAL